MKKTTYISKLMFIQMTGLLMLSSAPQAQAVEAWYTTDIDAVQTHNRDGGRTPRIFIELTDTAETPVFTGQEFRAPNQARREMLATLLTAVSNGFQAEVLVDLEVGNRPLILDLVLLVPAPAPAPAPGP